MVENAQTAFFEAVASQGWAGFGSPHASGPEGPSPSILDGMLCFCGRAILEEASNSGGVRGAGDLSPG